MTKIYSKAPLPFVGQKRMFLKQFRTVLDNIPNDGEGWTIIDVFGGSGLLAHTAKAHKPKATVIYNDFDGYTERLKHIYDINRLRHLIFDKTKHLPRNKKIDNILALELVQIVKSFDGYVDARCVSSWLLFSGKQINHIDELASHTMYNVVRTSNYETADNYLSGLIITSQSFNELIPQYYDKPNTLLLLDPPYICTEQKAYGLDKYFGMVGFLTLMTMIRPPYVFFSSTKSELLDYLEYVKQYEPQVWARIGNFEKLSFNSSVNYHATYEDNMIYKF